MLRYLGATQIDTYTLLNAISMVSVLIWGLFTFKIKCNFLSNATNCIYRRCVFRKYKVFSKIWFWAFLEIIVIYVLQNGIIRIYNHELSNFFGIGTDNFGTMFFSPLVLTLFCYIVALNPLKQIDIITPAYALGLFFTRLGCFFFGCCKGFECSWGLYFPSLDIRCFPTQLVEAIIAMGLFVFLCLYKKKAKEGTLFPIYMILYSVIRFFNEFTNDDTSVFLIFNKYHITCLVGLVVGIIEYVIVIKYSDRIKSVFDRGFVWNDGKIFGIRRAKK